MDMGGELERLRAELEREKAKTAAIRRVLVDCHAHDLYVKDGAAAADAYQRAHGRGIPWDESAADHDASVRAAIDGSLGGELLDELHQARRSLGEGPSTEIARLRLRLVRAERELHELRGEQAASEDELAVASSLGANRADALWALTSIAALTQNIRVRDMARRLLAAQRGPEPDPDWPHMESQIAAVVDEAVRICAQYRVERKTKLALDGIEAMRQAADDAAAVLGSAGSILTTLAPDGEESASVTTTYPQGEP